MQKENMEVSCCELAKTVFPAYIKYEKYMYLYFSYTPYKIETLFI